MRPCHFFPRREGVLGIGHLVVFLFRQCITYCNKCKLCSKWHWRRYALSDHNGSLGSHHFLYVMNERTSFALWASAFESSRLVIGLKLTSDQKVARVSVAFEWNKWGLRKDSTSLRIVWKWFKVFENEKLNWEFQKNSIPFPQFLRLRHVCSDDSGFSEISGHAPVFRWTCLSCFCRSSGPPPCPIDSQHYKRLKRKMPIAFHSLSHFTLTTTQLELILKSSLFLFYGLWYIIFLHSASILKAIEDSDSFLFTLVNPSGSKPMMIKPKQGAKGGIRCDIKKGPCFGTPEYYDLGVWRVFSATSPRDASSQLDLGYGFIHPEGVDKKKFFTGNPTFKVDELEVFRGEF